VLVREVIERFCDVAANADNCLRFATLVKNKFKSKCANNTDGTIEVEVELPNAADPDAQAFILPAPLPFAASSRRSVLAQVNRVPYDPIRAFYQASIEQAQQQQREHAAIELEATTAATFVTTAVSDPTASEGISIEATSITSAAGRVMAASIASVVLAVSLTLLSALSWS